MRDASFMQSPTESRRWRRKGMSIMHRARTRCDLSVNKEAKPFSREADMKGMGCWRAEVRCGSHA